MTLTPGARLSSYEILESIGVGGMGEVYKARDTKLGREVAIKVLPEAFAENKERLARFEREARLLASLNHPNIATLFDLQEHDGTHFLILELVPGETLAERIARGPIPIDEALPLFKQIAEGLEAAHENGIIHRDLKPANIKVTPEGKVKVLDFGLAKAMAGETPEGDLSESPTISREHTEAGVLLGTAAYMSPEQARGKEVDKRTDIWAFGCCLYEAVTGQKTFRGDTVTDTIAAVVRVEPDWSALPADIPWRFRDLISRCLRKDPTRRLCEMASVRLDIEDAASADEPKVVSTRAPGAYWTRLWAAFLAGVTLAALATAIAIGFFEKPESGAIRRFAITLPTDVQVPNNKGVGIALSPDRNNVVYLAQRGDTRQLFSRPMDQLTPRPLLGTEGAHGPFFSPNGQWIGFWAEGQIKKMPVSGGLPTALCDAADFRGAFWAPDDRIYFGIYTQSGILRVAASGGSPERVTALESERGEINHSFPTVLPGGEAVLFNIWSGGDTLDLAVQSLKTGERKILVSGGSNARYTSTGHLVLLQAGSLRAAAFDVERLEISGSPTPVLDGVFIDTDFEAEFDLSNDGTLVYVPSASALPRLSTLVWVDRQGVERPVTDTAKPYAPHPRVSPDGKRLAISIESAPTGWDIWVLELERGALTRLTFGGLNLRPIWSHDGTRVFFCSSRGGGSFQIFWKPADGSGDAQQLTKGAYRVATSVSPDGKSLFFRQQSDDGSNWDIGMLRLEGDQEPEVLLGTPFDESMGTISPDSRWLAYVSNEAGREEIYVRPFNKSGGRTQVSTDGGTEPRWSRDGRELFYRLGDKMMAVSVSTKPDLSLGPPKILFEGNYQSGVIGPATSTNFDVSSDGQHFVMVRPEGTSAPVQINVVLNWFEELKRLVPTN